ncbi:MAG: universal stress protein [Thermoanaerobaculia bacterium]|nr:universal stress protein [Thermoanaerobaculia bacterium]
MIKRILLPVDFSETSQRAARWGIELASQLAAEALVVIVLDVGDLRVAMDAGLHGFENDEDVKRQVQEWIDSEYAKIVPPDAQNVRREIRRGIVEKEIIETVAQYEPQLIVMGSVGITRRLPVGSKTVYVIGHCKVPVTVVR